MPSLRLLSTRPPIAWAALRPASWPNSLLAALLIATLTIGWASSSPELSPRNILGGAVVLVPFFLLPWRPRIPEFLLIVAVVSELAAASLGLSAGSDVVSIVAVYTIAAERTQRATLAAIAAATAAEVAASLILRESDDLLSQAAGWALVAILIGAVAALGRYMARRRAYVRNLVVRTQELERDRQLLAKEAVATERARIARELHDVVAHHVSVMVIQAGAAQATLPPGADTTAQSLEAIRQTGREAMAEMRRLLGLLRSDGPLEGAPGREDEADDGLARAAANPDRSPQPGLADLENLADRTREAGLIVDLEVRRPVKVAPGVDLSAYRIVQEALTNTLRHAGVGARVHVCVDYEPDELVVEIADDGRGRKPAVERAPNEVGHGLLGMRERVALFGGSLSAGPRAEGGFRIVARFPLEDEAPRGGQAPL